MEQTKNIIENATNVRVYFIKKAAGRSKNHTAVIFPNAINDKIKESYQGNFCAFTKTKEVCEYDGVHQKSDAIQSVATSDLDEWTHIRTAITTAEEQNIRLTKESFTDDYSLIVVVFEKATSTDIERVFLVTKYKKTESWYHKSVKYTFVGGTLKEADKEIFVLNGYIDVVITEDDTYILVPKNFESIFNYSQKIVEFIEENKANIESWAFLNDPSEFYKCIRNTKTAWPKMERVLRKSLEILNSLTPKVAREKLSHYEEFKSIEYDVNDKIVVNSKNRDLIIDILLNVYAKNLFNDELVQTKGV